MIMGASYNDKICNYDLSSNNYQWKQYESKMVYSVNFGYYYILLGFENIIFIFYFSYNNGYNIIGQDYIYCVDILFNKWYKSIQNVTLC